MKEISIRDLHRHTGEWVRSVKKHGAILVSDRRVPVATLVPAAEAPAVNRFSEWKPLPQFSAALGRSVAGRPVEDVISSDRDR